MKQYHTISYYHEWISVQRSPSLKLQLVVILQQQIEDQHGNLPAGQLLDFIINIIQYYHFCPNKNTTNKYLHKKKTII